MRESIDLGLDFGSIFFRAAYMLDGEVVPIPISRIERVWSGAVFFPGPMARKPFLFESLKSSLGLAMQVVFGREGITVKERLRELLDDFKTHVEDYAGGSVRRAAIAVPGYYPEVQRAAIRELARQIGFRQVELIDDCQAAALGYTTLTSLAQPLRLLVFSMGFMGFEVSLLMADRQGCHKIAERGGLYPSGRDIDRLLIETCVVEAEQRGMPLPFLDSTYSYAWLDLRDLVEEAKKRLGLGEDAQITLPADLTGKLPLPMLLRVADFEASVHGYVTQTMEPVMEVLSAGGVEPSAVDKVLLVGGTTRLPSFQASLRALFGPNLIQPRENLLARGAAVHVTQIGISSAPGLPASPGADEPGPYRTRDLKPLQEPSGEIPSPPTPEAILSHAQSLAETGDYDAAARYLARILASIEAAWARLERQRPA